MRESERHREHCSLIGVIYSLKSATFPWNVMLAHWIIANVPVGTSTLRLYLFSTMKENRTFFFYLPAMVVFTGL